MRVKCTHVLFHVTLGRWILVATGVGRLQFITRLGLPVVKRIRLDILLATFHRRRNRAISCTISLRVHLLVGLIFHIDLVQMQLIIVIRSAHAIWVRVDVLVIVGLVLIWLVNWSATDPWHVVSKHITAAIYQLALPVLLGIINITLWILLNLRLFDLAV